MKLPLNILTALALAGLLVACESTPPAEAPAGEAVTTVTKSPNDDREYRYVELDNGLKVLLVSDMDADKSAASLSVFRGSFDDPEDRPGLAHFLEHMLFIGTEKYPEPDGYFAYVKANGGTSNAYTSTDHTNYFFDIRPEAFHEGLDRFAQFFISPLFQKEYVEREKNAVHSEYQLQLKDDGWRSFMIQKVAVSPSHPYSKFNIGTLDTLAGDVHAALLRFFENNYSANQMGLVVLTNEPLDAMESLVSDLFSAVPNRDLPEIERTDPLFLDGQLPATLTHDNIKDEYSVTYSFALPAIDDYYDRKPLKYISNLVGHEGDGSLHKLLNAKGWIKALRSGESEMDAGNSVLEVEISLTEEGARNIPDITGYLFSYLDMLRAESPKQWIYREQSRLAELAFRFEEEKGAMSTTAGISPALAEYPPEDILVAGYLMEAFDAPLISRFLELLKPGNVLVTISRPGFKGNSTEKWFSVSYDLQRGAVAAAPVDATTLRLPDKNPFLPDDLGVLADDGLPPSPVMDTGAVTIFLDTDTEFGVPRAVTYVSLRNEQGLVSLRDISRAQLYRRLVLDDLNALAYPAYLAGMGYGLEAKSRGFQVRIVGYNDKQLVLLNEVLDRLKNLDITPDRFAVLKQELLKDLENFSKERPYQQGMGRLRAELLNSTWTPEAMIGAIETITLADLERWRDATLDRISTQALVHGNVSRQRVRELADLVDDYFDIATVAVGEPLVEEIDRARTVSIPSDHADAAMVLYVQVDEDGFGDMARSALLTHLLSPGYFSSLRTEQQLGYIVAVIDATYLERGGMGFIIQSPVQGPDELLRRTREFMAEQVDWLAGMTEEEFMENKSGLVARLTQKDKNLVERSARYWVDLDLGRYKFDSNIRLAEEVMALDRATMLAFLEEMSGKLENEYLFIRSEGRFR